MTGFPLPPGVHQLKAIADVREDGSASVSVHDARGNLLVTVEATETEWRSLLLAAATRVDITTAA